MKFRNAKREDVPEIVSLLATDDLGSKREVVQNPLPNQYYVAFDKIVRDDNQELIVLEDNLGKIIGTLQLSFLQYLTYQGGIRAQIEAVRIRTDQRGKGLGDKMIQWAVEQAKKRGAHLVQLTTDKKRPEALKFYQSLGFESTHEGMKMHLGQRK